MQWRRRAACRLSQRVSLLPQRHPNKPELGAVVPELRQPHATIASECPVTDLLFGLSAWLDAEGRPLGERRAPSAAKIGVDITLKACPYRDSRRGLPMNVSALAQLTSHLDAVLTDLAAFRRAQEPQRAGCWAGVLQAVVDLLFAPGRWLIESGQHSASAPLRAADAVAHKLAAGYFGVLHGILRDEIGGHAHCFSADVLLQHVVTTRALHGASEVCGGPPAMIDRVTRTLFAVSPLQEALPVLVQREHSSALITAQLVCGLEYQVLDAALERTLFEVLGASPAAKNAFIRQQWASRHAELQDVTPPVLHVTSVGDGDASDAVLRLDEYFRDGFGALQAPPERVPALMSIADAWLKGYQRTVLTQMRLERQLRSSLNLPASRLRSRNGLILPHAKTARWLEALSGTSLRYDADLNLTLHRIRSGSINLTPNIATDAA